MTHDKYYYYAKRYSLPQRYIARNHHTRACVHFEESERNAEKERGIRTRQCVYA